MTSLARRSTLRSPALSPPWLWRPIASRGAPRVLLTNLAREVRAGGLLDVGTRLYQRSATSIILLTRLDGSTRVFPLSAVLLAEISPAALWMELVDVGQGVVYRTTLPRRAGDVPLHTFTARKQEHAMAGEP